MQYEFRLIRASMPVSDIEWDKKKRRENQLLYHCIHGEEKYLPLLAGNILLVLSIHHFVLSLHYM